MKIISTARRISQKIVRGCKHFGFNLTVRETLIFNPSNPSGKRLLILASGEVSIPPDGWGAVETIISETIPTYLSMDFEIMVVNSKAIQDLYRARSFAPSVILVHDDIATKRTRLLFGETPIVTVTHYGLAASEDLWHPSYRKVLKKVNRADYVICLNPRIKVQLSKYIDESKLVISPNGSSFDAQPVERHNSELICVGKVEPRKKQFELFQSFFGSQKQIKFVGAIADERVNEVIKTSAIARESFVGAWSRAKLIEMLPMFEALILISSGEADALVLYEAQIAGLPILVTPSALGSQDPNLNWIQVIPDNPTLKDIEIALSKINSNHMSISKYSKENYSWANRNSNLVNLLIEESNRK